MKNNIEKQIELSFPISRVWQALTDYKQFGEWFMVKLEAPFAAGQEARGHITYPGYEHHQWKATVQKLEPEKVFSFTWYPYALDPQRDYSNEKPTLNEFRLEKTEKGTLLKFTESGFEHVSADRRDEAYAMNERGWTEQMKNIEKYLKTHS